MFTKHVHELLVYVSKTCPSLTKPIKKLVAVTPVNKDKKVRFVEPIISSSNITKQTDSLRTKDSNKPLLTSTGVNTTTSASGSKSSGNTKKNRISRPPSSNQENKVEEHLRNVKSSLNKKNSISKPISKAIVKHFVRNAKFESMCAICNKRLFDVNHDMCLVDYVNVCSKSKSKRNKMRKVWKPMGKVFTKIGYSWKPIGRIFIIVRNSCPLTKITATNEVPLKETTITPVVQIVLWSMRIQGINGRKYILVIVDDYSRFTWVKFLRSKDEVPEYLGKLKSKADIGFFVGYAPATKAFRIYNKRTRIIIETIHVDFDELTAMASKQFSSGSEPKLLTPGTIRSGLVQNIPSSTSYVPPTKND
ncbi:retrovirus-related pol polyprotein from transposon TNT 1-94 [Tanacetum coccineum]